MWRMKPKAVLTTRLEFVSFSKSSGATLDWPALFICLVWVNFATSWPVWVWPNWLIKFDCLHFEQVQTTFSVTGLLTLSLFFGLLDMARLESNVEEANVTTWHLATWQLLAPRGIKQAIKPSAALHCTHDTTQYHVHNSSLVVFYCGLDGHSNGQTSEIVSKLKVRTIVLSMPCHHSHF